MVVRISSSAWSSVSVVVLERVSIGSALRLLQGATGALRSAAAKGRSGTATSGHLISSARADVEDQKEIGPAGGQDRPTRIRRAARRPPANG